MKQFSTRRIFSADNLVAFFVWAFLMAVVLYYSA